MSNELIWFGFAFINFVLIVLAYKLFGKTGLIAWIAMGTVLANIQVVKTIELFGLTATLGNIMFGTLFLATDALNEKYGLKVAKRSVYIGFFSLLAMVIIMQVVMQFTATQDSLEIHEALVMIFSLVPRIAFASLSAYLISQLIDVYLFQKIKGYLSSQKFLYVRNIGSTLVSQLVDSILFVTIAFLGVFPTSIFLEIMFTTYFIKLIVALLDTPFIYLMVKIKPLNL